MWDRSTAPRIPKTKDMLLDQLVRLNSGSKEQPSYLKSLTRDELRQLFREQVRGERHPADPTNNMTSTNKCGLVKICEEHNLPSGGTRGNLMLQIREHWLQQCQIAQSQQETGLVEDDQWSVVREEEEPHSAASSSGPEDHVRAASEKVGEAIISLIQHVHQK